MSQSIHTYGPTCHQTPLTESKSEDDVPHLSSQFFYSSPLHLDDPLSAVPVSGGSDSKSVKHLPRPFSTYDNKALEEAWQGLVPGGKKSHKKDNKSPPESSRGQHEGLKNQVPIGTDVGEPSTPKGKASNDAAIKATQGVRDGIIDTEPKAEPTLESHIQPMDQDMAAKHSRKVTISLPSMSDREPGHTDNEQEKPQNLAPDSSSPSCQCEDLEDSNDEAGEENSVACEQSPEASNHETPKKIRKPSCAGCIGEAQGDGHDERFLDGAASDTETPSKVRFWKSTKATKLATDDHKKSNMPSTSPPKPGFTLEAHDSQLEDSGVTGSPFVKLPSRSTSPQPDSRPQPAHRQSIGNQANPGREKDAYESIGTHERETTGMETEFIHVHTCKAHKSIKGHAEVPVGVSRLHSVTLPNLQMKPIYWNPVSDVSAVIRGTWFYKDTMYPVEPAVANQLEAGYRDLRPWSQTWKDEINSAIEVGAAGEEKIAHHLWPKQETQKSKSTKSSACQLSSGPYCAARCFYGEVSAEGNSDPHVSKKSTEPNVITKRYANAQVIYKDNKNAFILKPNLQPSAYYGRKPLQKIKKGTTVGIPVVRGFDWKSWDKLHPARKASTKVEEQAAVSGDANTMKGDYCPACKAQEDRPKVTDLILVIHGIGQKLSERVESFHFTHAINDFRRSVNVELCDKGVQKVLRKDLGGVMTLPVNWRSNLSFEDGGLLKNGENKDSKLDYSLPDVTQDSLPSVRKMISDVMLDIPYYMSAHKPKMIQAVIQEANRIYRLWCQNNTDFEKDGRVHIIAHSLGSAMAVEILSKQPTLVPKLKLSSKKINTKHFDFKTANLFFAGSPVGFFLLLEQSKLLPRRGQDKPDAETSDDNDKTIAGESGKFGCLAVDNIYNIMHYNDPIAYRLNATVDKQYADSLKEAQVPSASVGFFEAIGNVVREILPGVATSPEVPIGQVAKPAGVARLPSQLEMEVHDFTREEIAEKKFCLLNDNGQVDWYLNSGRGPLEIQYLNMLGAHSSYWLNPDFVRFVVIEVGRKPGKSHALPSMKAVKLHQK